MANWEAILKWSLKYHDETRNEPQMDEERRQWLQEALREIASAPTESQLLQAALTVLRVMFLLREISLVQVHRSAEGEGEVGEGEEEEAHLLRTFEEIQFLIEDLDNANNLIPMNGVEVIASYLEHRRPGSLVQASCELIATATQNNPKTQEAFLPTLPRLLTILNDRGLPSSVGVKALYAVSCMTRSYGSGVERLLSLDGLATLRLCLAAEDLKMVVKTLFLLTSYFSPSQGEVKALLVAQLPNLVPELVSLVRAAASDEVRGHALSMLVTMVTHHREAVLECRREEVGLRSVLEELTEAWSAEDHEEELTAIKTLMDTCFPA